MKHSRIFAAAAVLLALGIGSTFAAKKSAPKKHALKVVATIFPAYDWARQIAGERSDGMELTLLLDNGVDLHSYSPSVRDIAKIAESDIFIYVGGESDEWVEGVLESAKNKHLLAINLLETLGDGAKTEETVEGMQAASDDGEDESEYDEHVWLSLRNAAVFCEAISRALCEKDAQNEAAYTANLAAYRKTLSDLDARYKAVVESARRKTLLFADRFPFRYLVDDYNLSYYAAFSGCSAESEASFKTVVFLAEQLDALGGGAVCRIETGDGKLASTIIRNSSEKDAAVLTFDSMQATTASHIKKGATYLGTMEKNLSALQAALN